MEMKELTRRYYEAWAAQDRKGVHELLHSQLVFTSPQGSFDSPDSFLSACWRYSAGLAGVRFLKELYEVDRAFVILRWMNEDGSSFADAEYLESTDGKLKAVVVINNDPLFGDLTSRLRC